MSGIRAILRFFNLLRLWDLHLRRHLRLPRHPRRRLSPGLWLCIARLWLGISRLWLGIARLWLGIARLWLGIARLWLGTARL